MMISWMYSMLIYFISISLFINQSSFILFWIMMEINLLFFIMIMMMNKKKMLKQESINYLVFYFLIQSSASILFLSDFSFSDESSIFNSKYMFLSSLILKIGLFPLFFWVFNIADSLGLMGLTFLLTFQKVPLLSIFFSFDFFLFYAVLFSSFLLGSFLLFMSPNLIFMLISSSISYSLLMFYLFSYSTKLFYEFFLLYTVFLFFILMVYFNETKFSPNLIFLLSSFFLGIPPLSLFFFKFMFSCDFVYFNSPFESLVFWVFSLVGLVGYLKFLYFSFFLKLNIYLNLNLFFKKLTFFFLILLNFFFFFF